MAEHGGIDLQHTNSQSRSSAGKTKTSAAALGSLICGITGLIIIFVYLLGLNNYDAGLIIGVCFILSMILGIVLGTVSLVRIHRSSGRIKGSDMATTGLALNIILFFIAFMASTTPHTGGDSKARIAKIQIAEFEGVLEAYANDNGSFPTEKEGLNALLSDKGKGPYLKNKALPNDPWGRPYHYHNPGIRNPGAYDIWSNGIDGIEGTADDITSWK
jgi:general secretion pathway protein G